MAEINHTAALTELNSINDQLDKIEALAYSIDAIQGRQAEPDATIRHLAELIQDLASDAQARIKLRAILAATPA